MRGWGMYQGALPRIRPPAVVVLRAMRIEAPH